MYQTLKQRSGISEFILESVCRDFLEKHGRFPYLDEIPGSNSESYLKDRLKVTEHGGAKITNILEVAGKGTVEEAIVSINNQFRDLETTIVPINKEALVDIVHRPTDDNFDNWSEEDEILARAPRDDSGNLLAPNGKISNLTEKQYAQVRTKAFKEWFGDWEKVARSSKFRESQDIPNSITSATYQGVTVGEALFDPDMAPDGGTRIISLDGKYIGEIPVIETKDEIKMGGSIGAATEIEEEYRGKGYGKKAHLALANIAKSEGKILYSDSSNSDSEDALWKSLVRDGIAEVVSEKPKIGYWNHTTYRILNDKLPQADDINSGDRNVSKVVDENGEPLVVYHYTDNENLTKFSTDFDNYFSKTGGTKNAIFFTTDNVVPGTEDNFLTSRKSKLSLFLNIKNLETFHGTKDDLHKQGTSYREIVNKSSKRRGSENGIVFTGFDDNRKENQTIYVVHSSNQIKSATSNSGSFNRLSGNIYDIEPNDYLVLNNTLQKLAKLYGINFNTVTDAELNSERWADLMPESRLVNAFIYDGQIYINVDRAKLDAPIHEMLHIFVGSMRFTNPKLYQELIQLSEKFPNYDKLASQFSGKTRNDINEEVFITEVSKHLTGQKSSLTGIDEKLLYEISYNVHRVLDSVLMGTESSKTITDDRLYTLSLKDLAFELNSAIMTNNMPPLRDSELHRTLNNMKSDLMKEGKLEEICD